ncbi:MAG TPA: tetratricopeptide repeat protein [Candidatus Acidoferrales bacterium]|nr:tetratricopeptide repeat protein [Candidatus Acidoferrales bacterium]
MAVTLFLAGATLAASATAQVQMMSHHDGMASQDYPDLPPPPLMQGIGNASMKITTNSAEAQAYFNQGLRLLHDFWDFEAYRAFREAARQDPSAAMAYWGEFEALKMRGPVKDDTRAALDKAKSLMDKASDREQFYIRAAEHELSDTPEDKTAYEHEMEALIDRYPDDQDAQALYALYEMNGYEANGNPRPGELYSQALLRNLLAAHPDNAAANHYWIHAVEDSSHPELALHSADILASMAPKSGHMVHMPGHIYWRVGDYERARESFLASMHVDEAYMASQKIQPANDWNYAHNLAYLIAACAESGRYHEGLEIAKKLRDIPSPTGMTSASFVVWAGASVARVHIRFGDWQAVPRDPIAFGRSATTISLPAQSYADGLNTYAKGMDAIEKGDLAEAARQSDLLDASLWRLEATKPAKKSDAMDMSAVEPTEDNPTQVLNLLGTMSIDLRGNLKLAQGDAPGGLKMLQQAAEKEKNLGYSEPPRYFRPEEESLGYAYLKLKQWDKARDAFNESLRERPKSGHALYGIAQSYALAGDVPHATAAYRDFLAAWPHADSDLPQVKQANSWLGSHPSAGQ